MSLSKFAKENWKLLIASFKRINANFIYAVLFDLIFWLIIIFMFNIWNSYIFKGLEAAGVNVQDVVAGATAGEDLSTFEPSAVALDILVRNALIYTILLLLLIFICWTLSRLVIWLIIGNRNFTIHALKKFFLLNIIWQPINLILSAIIAVILAVISIVLKNMSEYLISIGTNVIIYILLNSVFFIFIIAPIGFFGINLTNIIYLNFVRTQKVKDAFVKAVDGIIRNFSKLAVSYLFAGLVLFLLIALSYPLQNLSVNISSIIGLIGALLFFTWSKFYLTTIIKN
ncbi:hypothetical protein HYU06_06255 [Candidatus Woesearchaeota archaeon]|nr:hypothetical protein [Candidatus Woesearchaeota archaeon]